MIVVIGIMSTCGQEASAQEASAQASPPLRIVQGKHIRLKSDGGSQESLTDLVESFDAAVPQWKQFWKLPPGALADWKVDAFVISDPQRFRDSGDLPAHLDFPFGYAINSNVWVMRQKSDYYTRHLLLHEGVHALVINQFDGTGPSWYAEGMAEMLGAHRGQGKQTLVDIVPESREVSPYWGRFKLLSQRQKDNRIPSIEMVLKYPLDLRSDVESYGWSWVAVMLLTKYPEYRTAMLEAAKNGSDRTIVFSKNLQHQLAAQWPIVRARWKMLAQTIDYGFDWSRERIDLSIKDELWNGRPIQIPIHADRGWQSTGVRFAPGMTLKISADGSCTLDDEPKPWVSEPPGVTIHYAKGRPLGQLLLCVLPNKTEERQMLEPLRIEAVESDLEIVIDKHCWVLLRINDYLGDMDNNQGGYSVTIRR
jgi:hypothetical protein